MTNNFATSGAPPQESKPKESEVADARFDLILLDPSTVRLFHTGGSIVRLELSDPQIGPARTYLRVSIARGFPLSDPDRYFGLRDGADKDIGMLAALEGLDAESRAIVEEELTRRYFLPKVLRVKDIKDEFGFTSFDVETDKGPRAFVVRHLRESVQSLSPTRVLVTDVDGNRWEFPDVRALDEKSYAVMQRVL